MTVIPKQERIARKGVKKQPQPAPQQTPLVLTGPPDPDAPWHQGRSIQHDINHVAGLGAVATHLDWIGDAVARLTSDPVKITLADNDYGDTMDRLITAFERIADSVAKLAGLNRPRLESWHEQDEYAPRYKDVACDGGAPGPATPTVIASR
jgi:hypothetical protein